MTVGAPSSATNRVQRTLLRGIKLAGVGEGSAFTHAKHRLWWIGELWKVSPRCLRFRPF